MIEPLRSLTVRPARVFSRKVAKPPCWTKALNSGELRACCSIWNGPRVRLSMKPGSPI
jgi:hypothetical protein